MPYRINDDIKVTVLHNIKDTFCIFVSAAAAHWLGSWLLLLLFLFCLVATAHLFHFPAPCGPSIVCIFYLNDFSRIWHPFFFFFVFLLLICLSEFVGQAMALSICNWNVFEFLLFSMEWHNTETTATNSNYMCVLRNIAKHWSECIFLRM